MIRSHKNAVTRILSTDGVPSRLSVRKFELRVVSGPNKGSRTLSEGRELTIGSGVGSDLLLNNDDTVSRKHCAISATDSGFELQDLDSTNGTWIKDIQITKVTLVKNTEFLVGNSRIRLILLNDRVDLPLSEHGHFDALIGESAEMRDVFVRLEKVSPMDVSVLLEGESGTGKELAARGIHRNSGRKDAPFEVFDCAAVAPSVIESELFGHEKGAFTGAVSTYAGVFERAQQGTVFIDEIGELRPDLQPKLLRVLETGEYRRVGGNVTHTTYARIIAATNRDLRVDVNTNRFRLDLYYRLATVRIVLPPLRNRKSDIALLVDKFAQDFSVRNGQPLATPVLSAKSNELLEQHQWPGNVRELKNFVEQSLVLAELANVPEPSTNVNTPSESNDPLTIRTDLPYKDAREQLIAHFCRQYFSEMLKKHQYNISKLAKDAQIDRVYAQRIIKKYGLK